MSTTALTVSETPLSDLNLRASRLGSHSSTLRTVHVWHSHLSKEACVWRGKER